MNPKGRANPAADCALFVLIVLVPLAWTKLFNAEFALAKLLTLNFALLVAAWGAVARPYGVDAASTSLDIPLAALFAALAFSAAISADPATNLRGRYDSYAYGLWGLALAGASAQFAARFARGREEAAVRWLGWSAGAVGGYAVLQRLGFDPIFHYKELPSGRAVSTLGSPIDLGAMLALLWPAMLWRLDAKRDATGALLAACAAGGLIACGARGALIAAGIGTAAYLLLTRLEPGTALRRSLGMAAVTAALALCWAFRSGASVSDQGRREVWKTAFGMFLQRPWLGWGPDGFEDAFKLLRSDAFISAMGSSSHYQAYAHNGVLHVLAGWGLAGAAAYLWLLAALAGTSRRGLDPARTRALAAALTAALLALWVNMEFNPVALEVLALAAVCAGLLCSLAAASPPRAPSRGPLLALAALATCSFAYSVSLARADAAYKRALKLHAAGRFSDARAEFSRVRRAAPCELVYITGEVNSIGDWINATHVVDERLALLAKADADGREALFCHPRQAGAHYIAAYAARMHAELGFKDRLADAAREFDLALALDPKFEPLLDQRREVARLMAGKSPKR